MSAGLTREYMRLYHEGQSLSQIARTYGFSHVAVYHRLKRVGVEMRPFCSVRRTALWPIICDRLQGQTMRSIATSLGISYAAVTRRVNRAGIILSDVRSLTHVEREIYRTALDIDRLSHQDAMDIVADSRQWLVS